MSNPNGRPLIFPTPESLIQAVEDYFSTVPQEDHTLTGLCLSLGTTKETLDDYKVREGYGDIVKLAKLRIEHAYEVSLRKNNKSGDIFALKNFGWKDSQQHEHGGPNGGPILVAEVDEAIIARTLALMAKSQG